MKSVPRMLPTGPYDSPSMDYDFLRQEGIRLLERLSGGVWTDFNAHDPGITILEQVCYALTDLAYRIDYDIKDLLASGGGAPYRSLYSPAEILTTNPVTLTDLRKQVIDLPGVRRVWFEPASDTEPGLCADPFSRNLYLTSTAMPSSHHEAVSLLGLYRVLLELDPSLGSSDTDIVRNVTETLLAHRLLGDDFLFPEILQSEKVIVNAGIEVSEIDDPAQKLAEIYFALAGFISPGIRFHTLSEMLERGYAIEEMMDGPALLHGFVEDADLERFERRVGLRTSDLIQVIMDVDGVVTIDDITLASGEKNEKWYLQLDPDRTPDLDVRRSIFDEDGGGLRLLRNGLEVQLNPERVYQIFVALKQHSGGKPLPESERNIRPPVGRDRQVARYHSIQHQFPAVFGVGPLGLPDSAPPKRKAYAKQLKAYLMFFDQLLADSFAQLASARQLFSYDAEETRTYYSQSLEDDALDLKAIRKAAPEGADASGAGEKTIVLESHAAAVARKNRFLNHLLARFAEQFNDYALLVSAPDGQEGLIEDKCAFLQAYREIGASRGTGVDYTRAAFDTGTVSGLEKRIRAKLGMPAHDTRRLGEMAPTDDGGFYVLEHILLRPGSIDSAAWRDTESENRSASLPFLAGSRWRDPYSRQISFVFPQWIERFLDDEFSTLIEKTVREETPAHLHVHLHWLEKDDMAAFESALEIWWHNMTDGKLSRTVRGASVDTRLSRLEFRDARDRMVRILGMGLPCPLRDVLLKYPPVVALNHRARIAIQGGQEDVVYQLCDEDGLPVEDGGNGALFSKQDENGVYLETPAILKDITYTILAVRSDIEQDIRLETFLIQEVGLKVGIDVALPVGFNPTAHQRVADTRIYVDFGDTVKITIGESQEGVSYQMVSGSGTERVVLSSPEKGNKGDISLDSTNGFSENTALGVLAFRTDNPTDSTLLDARLTVLVRPDTAITVGTGSPVVDYNRAAVIVLKTPQSGVSYQLFKRPLVPSEYLAAPSPRSMRVGIDAARGVYLQVPPPITDWRETNGFEPGDMFENKNQKSTLSSGALQEDTVFVVKATDTENGESVQLHQAVVVLVKPDPAPKVAALQAAVASGAEGTVTVSGTQKGVAYQLCRDSDGTPVNPPGFDLDDRGIDTTRLEVDFMVEGRGDPLLLLPTMAVTEQTAFNVTATKRLTGLSVALLEKATIDVLAPPPGDGAPDAQGG